MDKINKKILHVLQNEFPVTLQPFTSIASLVHCGEQELLQRISKLKDQGIVRQISPIFDSARIGYRSTLAAFSVEESRIDEVAQLLNAHPGVSHNYLRDGQYNIWFTLTVLNEIDVSGEITRLANDAGISNWLYLPALRTFGIGFKLDLGSFDKASKQKADHAYFKKSETNTIDRDFIRELQDDLPLVERPFEQAALRLGRTEENIVKQLLEYIDIGIVRRVAAILRPVQSGYKANVLVAWAPAPDQVETLGVFAASLDHVSHCYERPSSQAWRYSVYTMIHGRTTQECMTVIKKIKETCSVKCYCELPTIKEFKKVRVRYF